MNTTFVLHGGKTSKDSSDNALFFKQFTSVVKKDHVKILMCYWAQEKKKWKELFKRDKAKIMKQSNKAFELIVANDSEELFTQLQNSDVLYVSGGYYDVIKPYLSAFIGLSNALMGKIYIGSSMGAFLVSRNYVLSLDKPMDQVYEGMGLVSLNTLCHWNVEGEKEEKITMLKVKEPHTPILLLDEEKFTTIVQ